MKKGKKLLIAAAGGLVKGGTAGGPLGAGAANPWKSRTFLTVEREIGRMLLTWPSIGYKVDPPAGL